MDVSTRGDNHLQSKNASATERDEPLSRLYKWDGEGYFDAVVLGNRTEVLCITRKSRTFVALEGRRR